MLLINDYQTGAFIFSNLPGRKRFNAFGLLGPPYPVLVSALDLSLQVYSILPPSNL